MLRTSSFLDKRTPDDSQIGASITLCTALQKKKGIAVIRVTNVTKKEYSKNKYNECESTGVSSMNQKSKRRQAKRGQNASEGKAGTYAGKIWAGKI